MAKRRKKNYMPHVKDVTKNIAIQLFERWQHIKHKYHNYLEAYAISPDNSHELRAVLDDDGRPERWIVVDLKKEKERDEKSSQLLQQQMDRPVSGGKFTVGQVVTLKGNKREGWKEEAAKIVTYEGKKMYIVEVKPDTDTDDGIREVHESMIKKEKKKKSRRWS